MRRRTTLAGSLAVVAMSGVGPAHANAAEPAPAIVKITHYSPPPIIGSWHGFVVSERTKCEKERRVTLFRQEGQNRVRIGNDETSANGNRWNWSVFAEEESGRYFAIAPATPDCERAESRPFRYPQDNPPPRFAG